MPGPDPAKPALTALDHPVVLQAVVGRGGDGRTARSAGAARRAGAAATTRAALTAGDRPVVDGQGRGPSQIDGRAADAARGAALQAITADASGPARDGAAVDHIATRDQQDSGASVAPRARWPSCRQARAAGAAVAPDDHIAIGDRARRGKGDRRAAVAATARVAARAKAGARPAAPGDDRAEIDHAGAGGEVDPAIAGAALKVADGAVRALAGEDHAVVFDLHRRDADDADTLDQGRVVDFKQRIDRRNRIAG